jgi:hypothetical protein
MVKSTSEGFPPRLIELAHKNPSGELAWQYPTILQVVATLAAQGDAILGGDVMYDAGEGTLDYYHNGMYCGNWHLNWEGEWSWAEYVAESVAVTIRYVETYVLRNDGNYWFVPVFADEERYAALQAHKA